VELGLKAKEMKDPFREDVASWLASDAADKVADYAARGRKHKKLTDEQLTTAWQTAFKNMTDDVRDCARRAVQEDLKSEFVLRGQAVPFASIRDIFERNNAETYRAINEFRENDPAVFEEITRKINNDFKQFRSGRDKSKN
jgi:hypothetical protein